MAKPEFLGIGAQKSGTTWLHLNLVRHPDLWLPPIKEIHYFDGLGNMGLVKRNFSSYLSECYRGTEPDWSRIEFIRRFVFEGPKDSKWYQALFELGGDRISGEITPAYSIVPAERIRQAYSISPNSRLILILRDPIDRAWSALKFNARKLKSDPRTWGGKQIREHLEKAENIEKTSFSSILDNWTSVFPNSHLLVLFYDDIVLNPTMVLSRVCDHIGVRFSSEYFGDAVTTNPNRSIEFPIPEEFEGMLAQQYRGEVTELAARLGSHAKKWLTRCEALLARR